jgi:hypothetical protein
MSIEGAEIEVFAAGDDVGPGDGAQLGDAAQTREGDKLLDIDFVGPSRFGIGEVGEPFELRRNFR